MFLRRLELPRRQQAQQQLVPIKPTKVKTKLIIGGISYWGAKKKKKDIYAVATPVSLLTKEKREDYKRFYEILKSQIWRTKEIISAVSINIGIVS